MFICKALMVLVVAVAASISWLVLMMSWLVVAVAAA